jgi:isoquinoline 1-oxidoreductase beta subunit
VGVSINCFAVESAIDEAALASGQDPLAFRRRLLSGNPRALAVLNAAANGLGWSTAPAAGFGRGLAITNGFGSIVAIAAEVTKDSLGKLKVSRISAAIDCGMAVNPGQVVSQLEGGIIQGISSALWQGTTFSSGKASTRNFSNNRLAKMADCGQISVQVIQSGAPIGGVGETGVPPVAPALANAWAKLTGTRQRSLPFYPGSTMGGS